MMIAGLAGAAAAQEFGAGARRELLQVETSALPRGKAAIEAGERAFAPGMRSPWHTVAGPKFLYVLEGTLTVAGVGGKTLLTCGPAPKICLHGPLAESWFFRNEGAGPAKALIIGIDPVENQTIHEEIGQVVRIAGKRVTLAVGNPNRSGPVEPRKEIVVTVADSRGVGVGDSVMTQRFDEKRVSASRLVKLGANWQ